MREDCACHGKQKLSKCFLVKKTTLTTTARANIALAIYCAAKVQKRCEMSKYVERNFDIFMKMV
jgi:hypothetical protein